MNKTVARIFFCGVPSVVVFILSFLFLKDVYIALIWFAAAFGAGWQITQSKPERGEIE